MPSRLTRITLRVLLIGGLFFLMSASAQARPLYLGTISPVPSQEIIKFQPIARYLETQLTDVGIHSVRIVIAKNIPQMAAFLKQKKVDIYLDSPFPSVAVSRLTESRLLLQGGAHANLKHASVIFVRTDSGLKRLKELKGKKIAFSTPFCTRACLNQRRNSLRSNS